MPTDRLTLEARPSFERAVLALMAVGVVAGLLVPWAGKQFFTPAVVLTVVSSVALLAASTVRGDDGTLPLSVRVLLLGFTAAIGWGLASVPALVLGLGGFAGLAMAGTNAATAWRRLVGFVGGAVGVAWGFAVLPALEKLPLPFSLRAVLMGAAAGVFVGVGMLGLHVKVHADALAARLTDDRLKRAWGRCHAALRAAPRAEKRVVLGLLRAGAEKACRLGASLQALDARLAVVDRKDAEAQVAQLKADAAAAADAMARQQLHHAAASLGDSLEALDALERKRERLGADLRLEVATLERAALSLEGAQGTDELRAVALRLTASAAGCPS